MELQDASQRWEQVFIMVSHMLSGNFSYQIPQSAHDDQLEQLIFQLNMLAQNLEAVFKRMAFIKPRRTFMFLVEVSFVLSKGFKILNASRSVLDMLKYKWKDLLGKDFNKLLHPTVSQDWKLLEKALPEPDFPFFNLRLYFETKDGLVISADCSVSEMIVDGHSGYLVSFFETDVLEDSIDRLYPEIWQNVVKKGKEAGEDPNKGLKPSEFRIVKQLNNLIHENLRAPMPDYKRFARENGMTIEKLRDSFKKVYDLTPVKYHRMARFLMMKRLVETTKEPLHEIAFSFNMDYAYFSNTFKKLFGVYPRQLREARKEKS